MNRIVPPSGPPSSPIYILGKEPSSSEIAEGKNFVGTDGKTLFRQLERVGILYQDCRMGNVSWLRGAPLGHSQEVLEDILAFPRKAILAVGEEALNLLTSKAGILKYRGSPLPFLLSPSTTVIPTIQPRFIREGNQEFLLALRSDCRKLKELLDGRLKRETLEMIHASGGASFGDFQSELLRLASLKEGFLSYDIEGWYPRVTAISFSDSPKRAVSVPLNGLFPWSQEELLWELVRKVLENELTGKVAHNMLFDNLVLRKWGIGVRNIFMDTMLAHHSVFQDLPHTLDFITSIYTNHVYYKDDRTLIDLIGHQIEADEYSCKDAAITLQLVNPLTQELVNYGVEGFFFGTIMERVKSAMRMQIEGMPWNPLVAASLREEKERRLLEIEVLLARNAGGLNPNSPKQMKEWLYEEKGLPTQYTGRGAKRRVTTDEDALLKLLQLYPEEKDLELVLEARGLQKEISTYIDAIPASDGRMYYSVNIGPKPSIGGSYTGGTVSGRYSMSNLLDGTGIPAQGIPKELRVIFTAPKGCVIWEADGSQAEARFVAWDAGEESLVQLFLAGGDVHLDSASILFNKRFSKKSLERRLAKTITHATNYWIGPGTLQKEVRKDFPGLPFSLVDAKGCIEKLRRARPKTLQWGQAIERSILAGNRIFRNPFGRMRMLLGPGNVDTIKSAISFRPQSTVADLTIGAKAKTQLFLEKNFDPKLNYIFNLTHDGIIGVCQEENIDEVKRFVREAMEVPIPGIFYNGLELRIPVEFSVGPNWRDLEEIR